MSELHPSQGSKAAGRVETAWSRYTAANKNFERALRNHPNLARGIIGVLTLTLAAAITEVDAQYAERAKNMPVECVDETFQPGDNGVDPVLRAAERLEQSNPDFSSSYAALLHAPEGAGLGRTIPAGTGVTVCAQNPNSFMDMFNDQVTVTQVTE